MHWTAFRRNAGALVLALCALLLSMQVVAQGSASSNDDEYVTQPGDSLNAIARRLLHEGGTRRVQRALQEYNGLNDADYIVPGQVLRFPKSWRKHQSSTLEVSAVQGGVEARGQPVVVGTTLAAGDTLRTDERGYVTLKLVDGSTLTLLPAGQASIERSQASPSGLTDTALSLVRGRVEADVHKASTGTTRFEIRTPVAVAAVRGTRFRVNARPSGAAVTSEVLEGTVALGGVDGRDAVSVPSGFGTRVNAGEKPVAPRPLLPAPYLWTGIQLVEQSRTEVVFTGLKGAEAYRVFVSPLKDFSLVLNEMVIQQPRIVFSDLANGDYFVRVRAIDDIELEGRDTIADLRVRLRPDPPRLSKPADGGRVRARDIEFNWNVSPGARSYVLQIARDASFRSQVGEWTAIKGPQHVVASLAPGSYVWRVAGVHEGDKRSVYAKPRALLVLPAPLPPLPPEILDDALLVRWPAEPAQRFEIQLAADERFEQIVLQTRAREPRARLPRPPQGTYFLRVRATDPDGLVGPYTEAVRVEVPRKEPKPQCLVPADDGLCATYRESPQIR